MKGVALLFALPPLMLAALMAPPTAAAQSAEDAGPPQASATGAAASPPAADSNLPTLFYKRLEGTIASRQAVVVNLERDGHHLLGTITCTGSGAPAALAPESRLNSDGSFILHAEAGTDTKGDPFTSGTFQGAFTSGHEARGRWTSGDGKQSYPFSLRESYPAGTARFELARATRDWTAARGAASLEVLYPVMRSAGRPAIAQRVSDQILSNLLREYGQRSQAGATPTLDGVLDDFINRFLREVHDPALPQGYNPFWDDSLVGWVVFNGDGIVSIRSRIFTFEGGAHPTTFYHLSSYSLASGEPIDKLSELLKPGSEQALNALGEAALREEYGVPAGKTLEEAGFFIKPGAFRLPDNFLLTAGGIEFQFNQYEIGPYVLGSPDLFIPYSKLKQWLRAPEERPSR